MKKFFVFIIYFFFIFSSSLALSLEVTCQFEEVYSDGSHQQGIFVFDNDKLRYQYHSPKLYTLIYDNPQLHAVQNNNTQFYQLVKDQHNIIKILKDISGDYPNFQKRYDYDEQQILVEMNEKNDFMKRLVFKSNQLNLSIYFQKCNFDDVDPKLFSYKNFIK